MSNKEIIFPTAEEMAGRTAASGLEKLIAFMKERAQEGRTSVFTYDEKEIQLINLKKIVLETLGYTVLVHYDYVNQQKIAELIWERKIR